MGHPESSGRYHPDSPGMSSLLDHWFSVWRQRRLVLIVLLITTSAAILTGLLTTPVYEAEVLLVPVGDEEDNSNYSMLAGQLGGLASLVGIGGSGTSRKNEAIALLESRAFTQSFIQELGLMPTLFARRWDSKIGDWRNDIDIPTSADAFDLFDREIRIVEEDKKDGTIRLSIRWIDREQCAYWANTLVARLNEYMRAREIEEAEKSLEYLYKQLRQNSVLEIQQGIFRLIEAQTKKIMLAKVREEFAFRVIDPAVIPDRDRNVSPRYRLLVMGGIAFGLFVGIIVALFRAQYLREINAAHLN